MKRGTQHPEQATLALLAGGDMAWPEALSARWHVHFCLRCRRQLNEFRSDRTELGAVCRADARQTAGEPSVESDSAWNLLEAEMRANVRLGLTAGSLASVPAEGGPEVEEAGEDVALPVAFAPWRWAVVGGALVFVLATGWWLRSPGGTSQSVASAPAVEFPAAHGSGQGAGMQLLVPVADVSRTETDFDGSTRSRVIDGETGQVTLQQVYVE